MYHYVYKVCSPSGRVYVGCTSNFQQRVYQHKSTPCDLLKREIVKYGFKNMVITIDKIFWNREDALSYEKEMIQSFVMKGCSLNTQQDRDTNILMRIEPELKERFKQLCQVKGETVSDNLIRHIKQELNVKEDK